MINQPVIFLPGTLCDERIWMPTWWSLSCNQRAYVPLQWATSLDDMLALSKDRLSAFEQKVHLVGYSMGGYIASLLACQNPERVASLHLVCYSPRGLSKQELGNRKALINSIKTGQYKGLPQRMLDNYFAAENANDQAMLDVVRGMAEDLGGSTLAAQIQATTPRKDMTSALAKATFPIHITGARLDNIAPADSLINIGKKIAVVSTEIIEDSAHMLPLENSQALTQRIQSIC